jgi:predicted nuclease with TOPRIM domain
MTELTPEHFELIDKNKAKNFEKEQLKKEIDRLSEENRNIRTINDGLNQEIKKLQESWDAYTKSQVDRLNQLRKDGNL